GAGPRSIAGCRWTKRPGGEGPSNRVAGRTVGRSSPSRPRATPGDRRRRSRSVRSWAALGEKTLERERTTAGFRAEESPLQVEAIAGPPADVLGLDRERDFSVGQIVVHEQTWRVFGDFLHRLGVEHARPHPGRDALPGERRAPLVMREQRVVVELTAEFRHAVLVHEVGRWDTEKSLERGGDVGARELGAETLRAAR